MESLTFSMKLIANSKFIELIHIMMSTLGFSFPLLVNQLSGLWSSLRLDSTRFCLARYGYQFIIDFKGSFEYFIFICYECGMLRVFVVY